MGKYPYYVPHTKKELVQWLSTYYAEPKAKFKAMDMRRLLAIYHYTRSMENPGGGDNSV